MAFAEECGGLLDEVGFGVETVSEGVVSLDAPVSVAAVQLAARGHKVAPITTNQVRVCFLSMAPMLVR